MFSDGLLKRVRGFGHAYFRLLRYRRGADATNN